MDSGDSSQFGTGLLYEDCVPVSWREVGKDVPAAQILRTHQSNERVLRSLAALDEQRAEAADEEHGYSANELPRLEFKLNLLLEMVARLLAEHVAIPAATPVRMSGSGICWRSPNAPAVGSLLCIDVYLHPGYPSPITLYGEVRQVLPADGGFEVDARYRDMSDAMRSWIEKLIFRHHRRQVAYSRQHGRN